MPKSKLKSHHNGHALTKGKCSIYQRNVVKREEERIERREEQTDSSSVMDTPPPPA